MTDKDLGQGVRGTTPSTYPSFKDQAASYGDGQTTQPSSGPTSDSQTGSSQASPSQASSSQGGSSQGGASQSGRIDIKQKVSEDVRSVKQTAQESLSDAQEKAKEAAANQKNIVAEKVGGLAAAMDKIGGELEQGDQADIGRITRSLGSTLQKFSDDIKDRDFGEIAGMAEDFGRKQPLAFMGLAAVAGLAASRFLTASAARGQASQASSTHQGNLSTSAASRSSFQPTGSSSTGSAVTEDQVHGQ